MDPPSILPEFYVYWEAYRDLQGERRTPRGTIPITPILTYASRFGLDPDTLKRIVWEVDRVLLDHWAGIDAAEKARQEFEAEQQRKGLGART